MSDRLAVFNHGRIEQIGSPAEIYEHPATAFVAGFVGVSNLCEGALAERLTGSPEPFAIRPEKIVLTRNAAAAPADHVAVPGRVAGATYLGATTRYTVALDVGGILSVVRQNSGADPAAPAPGDAVTLSWPRALMQTLKQAPA